MTGGAKDPGTAMLISTVLPGGGQVWAQGVGSAVTIWIALLLFGGGAIAVTSAHDENAATVRNQGWLMTEEQRREAEETVSSQGTMMFWLWVLVVVIWVANVYDARREALRHNAKQAPQSAPALYAAPSTFPPIPEPSPPTFQPGPANDDAGARLMRLAELRKAGALTDEEFQTKKQELLGRL